MQSFASVPLKVGFKLRDREHRLQLHRTVADHVRQVLPVEELLDLVNGADVGTVQGRSRLRLALKPDQCLGTLGLRHPAETSAAYALPWGFKYA
jgi:hypothetical protein